MGERRRLAPTPSLRPEFWPTLNGQPIPCSTIDNGDPVRRVHASANIRSVNISATHGRWKLHRLLEIHQRCRR